MNGRIVLSPEAERAIRDAAARRRALQESDIVTSPLALATRRFERAAMGDNQVELERATRILLVIKNREAFP